MNTFKTLYNNRPDKAEVGSSGYSNLKHLYDICLEINPTVIIESGTWKGNSSYIFRNACPNALIVCHDITFKNLLWKDDSIIYKEYDIEDDDQSYVIDVNKTLLYFDDHISHKKRIEWCIKKEFKYIIFDDNVDAKEAKTLKSPPTPTLQELDFGNTYQYKEYMIFPNIDSKRKNTYLTKVVL